MTVLVDSVLLGGSPALRSANPCRRMTRYGRPAVMIKQIEREMRARRVAPLVIVGVGYNSLWQRHRRNFAFHARRFDTEARRLLATLRRQGAKQFVWVTLRRPTPASTPPRGRGELGRYSWYFGYVNERLHRLARRRDDVVLADWAQASKTPYDTYDSIHVNPRGAARMARVINGAIRREAERQTRRVGVFASGIA
jgi:hypothetical protein